MKGITHMKDVTADDMLITTTLVAVPVYALVVGFFLGLDAARWFGWA
jgi:hypothetical protein